MIIFFFLMKRANQFKEEHRCIGKGVLQESEGGAEKHRLVCLPTPCYQVLTVDWTTWDTLQLPFSQQEADRVPASSMLRKRWLSRSASDGNSSDQGVGVPL